MKNQLSILICFCIGFTVSCIKSEPPYMEADIESFIINNPYFITSSISENRIQVIVSEDADYTKLTPLISLSPGAKVEPESGSVLDFSDEKIIVFTVTAEDGKHKKEYNVSVTPKIFLNFGFEEWTEDSVGKNKYPKLLDLMWSTANSGVAILGFKEYPTDKTNDCIEGNHAARLQTMKGMEVFGNYLPIFAGSLFWGKFNANLGNPLKSLRLGNSHPKENGKPLFFNGYYKYSPGAVFTDEDGNTQPNRTDSLSMYASLFKVTKGALPDEEYLDGETIQTSRSVIARAEWRYDKKEETDEPAEEGFLKFSIPFVYTEEIDFEKFDYRLTIVFSSSKDGNLYEGAAGSTLIVDDIEIVCEAIKN